VIRQSVFAFAVMFLTSVAAMGFDPMTATIRVSNGGLYDYVVIGENALATDGYDNAYDTISPGNLNETMRESFISAVVVHPDWKTGLREMRGDIRSPAKLQEWHLQVRSSLSADSPLKVELQQDRTSLPKGMRLTVKDRKGKVTDLRASNLIVPAPPPGTNAEFVIIAEQK